ncbi:MAG: two-component system, OmpR family, sensor histidine kinase VanS, partial [Mycobacterium sp.]|nr:two-component system, OmpR family, sensor histidine kinase VanS [Mycobacterium sp.]
MDRAPGLSVRLKLTLSYAGFVLLAGGLLIAALWVFLLPQVYSRVPGAPVILGDNQTLLNAFAPGAAIVMAFLLVFGLLGGWLLAGRMLRPL